MFYHVKDLQFNVRVSKPDPRFARLLLEQFGGGNGELSAAMQYFTQAFGCRFAYPDKYDMLMDIATEEFGHLEMVGAMITMLLSGVNGEMKNAVETSEIGCMMEGKAAKEDLIHQALYYPRFGTISAGGPTVSDSNGVPWCGSFVNANGDLTVDLRTNIAAESRAKIVYEYLMKFTDDPHVKEALGFLMTREVTHYQQFEAALNTIKPNFPPGVLQQDARFGNLAFNMSKGEDAKGPWNEGKTTQSGDQWRSIDKVQEFVESTDGLKTVKAEKVAKTPEELEKLSHKLSRERSEEVKKATKTADISWGKYGNKNVKM